MQLKLLAALAGMSVALGGCAASEKLAPAATGPAPAKSLIAELDRGWLRYKVYCTRTDGRQPEGELRAGRKRPSTQLVFSIMVLNMRDATSPLRRICRNLEEYTIRYEYLLNGAKADLQLMRGGAISYPAYFSFENNYNTLPFETINVGYNLPAAGRGSRNADLTLVFIDRVYSEDTIRIPIPAAGSSL